MGVLYDWVIDSGTSWRIVGFGENGVAARVHLEPRPAYCDRGNWIATIEVEVPKGEVAGDLHVDGADLWPRYYFDLGRAKLEIEAWFEKRGVVRQAVPESLFERMAKELSPRAVAYLRKMRTEIDSIEQVMLQERRQAMENTMVKMALGMAEKHGAKLKELAERAQKGESAAVALELVALSKEFQGSLELLRKAAQP